MFKRIETPADVAQGENGEPAYVMLRTQYDGQPAFLAVARQARQAAAEIRATKDISIDACSRYLQDVYSQVMQTFGYVVADWNWLDIDGQPLAKPDKNPDVFKDELSADQQEWLYRQIVEVANKVYAARQAVRRRGRGPAPARKH